MKRFVLGCFVAALMSGLILGPKQNSVPKRVTTEGKDKSPDEAKIDQRTYPEVGHPTFLSPHASPIAVSGDLVFAVNTPSDTLDVIDAQTRKIKHRIPVGIDPVSIAVRPDGRELWVSNHVSDSVSVIDLDATSRTYLHVIATIQSFDSNHATTFDEPVGIAFANNEKAYVALSSENQIAVIDVARREVRKRLKIRSQDPRDIVVRGNRLYVIPFESNNQTQLSGGGAGQEFDGDLITFDIHNHSVANNNVLSLGVVMDLVKHPDVPDRDLFVFDTETDELVETVDTLGTLLYGLDVDSNGNVFIAQTDARNDANGRAGTKKHGLAELENRAFLNRITSVGFQGDDAKKPTFIDLEPLPPEQPKPGEALATPFAIRVSEDDKTLYVTAAGSDKLFTVDTASGNVLGSVQTGAVPRGIAVAQNKDGVAQLWIHNAVENSISLVNVSDVSDPTVESSIALADPTEPAVKRGRIAFNTASASTTETYSCASCHPDGHTDQLLWVLKTPVVTGGDQIMPRSTMPIRGLRDTEPYHWDGIPGDPYGGNNSANVYGHDEPNSVVGNPESSARNLIDGGLAATMKMVSAEIKNDEGKEGALSGAERDDMSKFLLSVLYPPAQKRAFTNELTEAAQKGFELFHVDGDYQGNPTPNVCGDCHRMPFWVSTNTPGTGMDAPTWRGAYDRWLILPQGRLNVIDLDFFAAIADQGLSERRMWQLSWAGRRRFDPVWDMVLEGSTGFSGAFGRQVTLNKESVKQAETKSLLQALETAADEGAVVLRGEGLLMVQETETPVSFVYYGGKYSANGISVDRDRLIKLATKDKFVGTVTARHGVKSGLENPQPAIWTLGPIQIQRGHQNFPILHADNLSMTISGRHIDADANIVVDGRRVEGSVFVEDENEKLRLALTNLPDEGLHFLQLQNADGMFSNDFLFHVTKDEEEAKALRSRLREERAPKSRNARRGEGTDLWSVIESGDIVKAKALIGGGSNPNALEPESGITPLGTAILHSQHDITRYLLTVGADVNRTNRDGNSALHIAAFLCDKAMVELLLEKGASTTARNESGETPAAIVDREWTDELEGLYGFIAGAVEIEIDLEHIRSSRKQVAKMLKQSSK